jgi:hypothetical protein
MTRASGLAFIAAAITACGLPNERVAEQREAIHGGLPAEDPFVVALVERRTTCGAPPPRVDCTGVLVAERVVLTAAHCVARGARGTHEIFFGSRVGAPSGSYRGISTQLVHPRYDRARDDHDLALLWLDAPAPVSPLELRAGSLEPAFVGRTARVVGFGNVAARPSHAGSARLQGTVTLTDVGANTLSYEPSPVMTCDGDSGGPVLIHDGEGEVLVGVTTSGDALCEQVGVAARVDRQLSSFIHPALDGGAPDGWAKVAPGELCSATCTRDRDCPADLVCRADLDGASRCSLPELPTGSIRAACRSDAECPDASCVPFDDQCRCSSPCTFASERQAGCGLASEPRSRTSILFALALLGLSLGVRARRRAKVAPRV